MRRTSILIACFLVSGLARAADDGEELDKAMNRIRVESFRSSMTFLADDLLEGREAGTRGYDLAASWVAAQFEQMGLDAGGTAGYLQPIQFRRSLTVPGESSMSIRTRGVERKLVYGRDFYLASNPLRENTVIDADAVFVGFGITSSRPKRDDYAAVNVQGKIAVIFSGGPASFSNDERAYYSSSYVKARTAAAHGAIGIVTIRLPSDESRNPWRKLTSRLDKAGMRWVEGEEVGGVVPEILFQGSVGPSAVKRLFAASGRDVDALMAGAEKGKTSSFPLKATLRVRQMSRLKTVTSANVIGVLPGSDPALKNEFVTFTAHLDHEGIDASASGDRVYNGAYDNASGVSALLEVAKAFRSLPRPPARSVIFLAVTAEEKGLQGSDYFARHPTVASEQIVANINLDMFVAIFPLADVIAFGAEHSSLGGVVQSAAKRVGWQITSDPFPEEVVFIRSDQYSFVRQGVPAVFLVNGTKSADPSIDGPKLSRQWRREIYHTKKDDLSQTFHYPSLVKFARMNLLIGWRVADDPERPRWKEGDFFGQKLPY